MKNFIFTLFFILSQISAFSQDNYEPNDGFDDASSFSTCNQIDLTINNIDLDFFNFTSFDGTSIDVALLNVSGSIIPKVTIYDTDHTELQSWTGNLGENLISAFTPPGPGDYFVKIEDLGSNSDYSSYNFILADYSCPLSSNAEILTYNIPFQIDSDIVPANDSIHITMPYGTDVSALVAEFTLSEYAGAEVGTTNQISGSTPNNWTTNPVVYTISSQNGTIRNWSVYVDVSQTPQADILEYSIPGQINSEIFSENDSIHVMMPFDTDVTNLIAEFTLSYGADAIVGTTEQISSSTPNDWTTNPVIYTVTAETGSPVKEWSVYVELTQYDDSFEPNNDFENASIIPPCDLLNLTINNSDIDYFLTLSSDDQTEIAFLNVSGSITPKVTIYDTNETELESWTGSLGENLTETFTTPSSGIFYVKVEDIGNNYLLASYELIVADESCPLSSNAEILSYSIPNQVNSEIFAENDSIHVTMPYGTNVSELVAEFTLSEYADAIIGTTEQISESTPNDWTVNPVIYTVTSLNGTTRNWSVYVDIAAGVRNNTFSNIILYPNPTTGKFYMDIEKSGIDINKVEILNIEGKIVKLYNKSEINKINISNIEPGIYFIKIFFNNNVITRKINLIK